VELQPEWNEFLHLLKHHGVRFVMVGGLAVAVHGHERYTKDLDLLVDPSEANARRLGKALAEFGFVSTGRAWRRLTRPYQLLTLGVAPVRIDVLTSISGVAFRSVWKGRGHGSPTGSGRRGRA
jgi:predicted nucleotidyltransferase